MSKMIVVALAALLLQFEAMPQNQNLRATPNTVETSDPELARPPLKMPFPVERDSPARKASPSETILANSLVLNSRLPMRNVRLANLSLLPRLVRPRETQHREWLALMIAQHSAATFDAWSTRQAISTGRYGELNPM